MSKIVLIILGIAIALMGILALIPSLELATEPTWHAVVKVIVGIVAIILAAADKKK